MGFRAAALPLSLAALLAATACRDPTEARVILSTDALCADVRETSITSASDPSELEGRAPLAVTQACDAGSIGDLVLVPSDDKDAPFTVRVVTGLNKSADDCIADGYMGGCIVARRSLRFLPHRSIRLPIELEVACRDVPCDATQTCRHGSCVSASIDPGQCAGSDSCDVVDPGSGEAGAGGAGSDGGSAGASTNGGEGGAAGAPSNGGDDGGAAGAAGATPLGVCGDGHLADGEACDDGNAKPGDGCVGCKIAPDWGCRDEPSQCSQVAQLKLTIDGPDDLPDDALDRVFTPLPDERSYIYVGIDAPSPNGFEYCLARADWYAQNYLAYADSDLNVPSGTWDKWYRSPGEGWVADTSSHVNYFGNACEPGGRSLCIEWMLGEQLIGFQPAYTNGGEVFSNGYSDANSHWKTSLRVGPTRQSACGF